MLDRTLPVELPQRDQKDQVDHGVHRLVEDKAWTDSLEKEFDCTDWEGGSGSSVAVGEGDPYRGRWRPRHTGDHIHRAVVGQERWARSVAPSSVENFANLAETVFGGSMVAQMGFGQREPMSQKKGMRWEVEMPHHHNCTCSQCRHLYQAVGVHHLQGNRHCFYSGIAREQDPDDT